MTVRLHTNDVPFRDHLPVFALREYLGTLSPEYGWFVSDNFVMPWFVTTRVGFRNLRITSAPVAIGISSSDGDEQLFLDEACALAATELGVDRIIQSQNNAVFRTIPTRCVHAPYASLYVPLAGRSQEDLFAGVHSKHKNVIRKAERDGVTVSLGDASVGACIDLFRATMARQHMSVPPIAYFDRLLEALDGLVLLAAAEYEGVTQGCALVPWNRHGAYYFWGGSIEKPHGGALNLLHWRLIGLMRDRGVEKYDFVGARCKPEPGSKAESIQRFKERFGATLAPGHLWKLDCRPWRARVWNALVSAKSLLAGQCLVPDLIDQERARHGALP